MTVARAYKEGMDTATHPPDLAPDLAVKRDRLLAVLRESGGAAVAFSGGIDSTVVAKAAFLALGPRAVAVTADSPSVARSELDDARELAKLIGIRHVVVRTDEFRNPNVVKLVMDAQQRALYFSRAPIPWWRDAPEPGLPVAGAVLRHVGLYAYRAGFLRRFPQLPPSPLEQLESLEQLRVLWHGERIAVHVTAERPGPGVDTPEDLQRVRELLR